jgi:alkaline phosphatase D
MTKHTKNKPRKTTRRQFVVQTGTLTASGVVLGSLSACGAPSPPAPPTGPQFEYGVASGDPQKDSVILWTHVKAVDSTAPVSVTLEVATDDKFANIVKSVELEATEATAFAIKNDITGLAAGTDYFYRFTANTNRASVAGVTRTLPASAAQSVELAVFSCSHFSAGFFNAYEAAAKSNAKFAVHLGDFIYEYGSGPGGFANQNAEMLGRVAVPANDLVSLDDYRMRHMQYRKDKALQALLAKMPLIAVWDDHEFANNAYDVGAQNHDAKTQGDWSTRRQAAALAYHEWMPIRTLDSSNLLKIYRSFDFGNLFSLHMLDTRMDGRVQQYDSFGDADRGLSRYAAGLKPASDGSIPDASRKLISDEQSQWLKEKLGASTATWQLLGNQDLMSKMWIPQTVLAAFAERDLLKTQTAVTEFLAAKAAKAQGMTLTPAQEKLLDVTQNPRLPFNLDSWDGYPLAREALLKTVDDLKKNLVVISGDSHNGWFSEVKTLAGKKIGVEFGVPSVTSPGFDGVGLGEFGPTLDGSIGGAATVGKGFGLIDDLRYAETKRRGYLQLTVTPDNVRGAYVFVNTVLSQTYETSVGRTISAKVSGEISYE